MRYSDNLPLGAENDSSAPYNEPLPPEPIEMDCCVSYSMSKSMPVMVANYYQTEEFEADIDDEGHSYCHKWKENNFNDTNFTEEFENDEYAIGIPTLLKELQRLSKEKIESLKEELDSTDPLFCTMTGWVIKDEIKYYEDIIRASEGWTVDELDVERE